MTSFLPANCALLLANAVNLAPVDYSILLIYVVFVLGIGFALKRYMKTSADFLTSAARFRRGSPGWPSYRPI